MIKTQKGYLKFNISAANRLIPLKDAQITVYEGDTIIAYRVTDKSGSAAVVSVEAPDKELSERPGNSKPYETVDIKITKDGFLPLKVTGVQVFAGETSVLNADMIPKSDNFNLNGFYEYNIKPQNL